MNSMDGKTCIVTGASSGIGKVTAREIARMGARVVMVSRDRARGEHALADVRRDSSSEQVDLLLGDLSELAGIQETAGELLRRCERIDVLVNNAGAIFTSRTTTADGYERTFATNHLNYFLLTHLLRDRIVSSAPARIINVSSRAHQHGIIEFDDLHTERRYRPGAVYSKSKLANVLFTYELARRLDGTGVTANCLHPGVVRTGFAKNNSGLVGSIVAAGARAAGVFFIGPDKGAETTIYLASSPDVEGVTGKYFTRSRETPSAPISHDLDLASRLWQVSEELCAIAGPSQRQPSSSVSLTTDH